MIRRALVALGIIQPPAEAAFVDYMRERWDGELRKTLQNQGRVAPRDAANRAPELGPGIIGKPLRDQDTQAVFDELARIDERRRTHPLPRTYPEPVLVIDPRADPSDGLVQLLNDRGYNVVVAPIGTVKMLGEPWQVFTAADVALLREFTIAAEADDEHLDAMRAAAGSLADRIESALLEAPQ